MGHTDERTLVGIGNGDGNDNLVEIGKNSYTGRNLPSEDTSVMICEQWREKFDANGPYTKKLLCSYRVIILVGNI